MTESFEIMFNDLTEDAKKRFLSFMRIKSELDGNFDVYPIATVEVQTEVLEENEKETKAQEREKERKERRKRVAVNFT